MKIRLTRYALLHGFMYTSDEDKDIAPYDIYFRLVDSKGDE